MRLHPHPNLCRSILAGGISPAADYKFGFEIHSLEAALRISALVRGGAGAGAPEDCRHLFQLNTELLSRVVEDLRSVAIENSTSLDRDFVRRVRTRLSAVVANHRTCRDGLAETSPAPAISAAVSRAGKIYGVALGLVTQALVQNSTEQGSPAPPQSRPSSGGGQGHRGYRGSSASPPPAADSSGVSHRTPPPPAAPVPNAPERRQSLTDMIKGLKKSPNCTSSKKKLVLPSLKGNGILVSDSVIVSKDGTGDFTTIGEAIEIVPENLRPEDGYFVIYTKRGVYEEYISIPSHKQSILLLGDGINATIITGNHSYATGWPTFHSATFAVEGDNFIAMDVTFRNTAGPGSQAVAVLNQADRSAFFRCGFEGYQDTLYAHSHTHFYRDCHVTGTVDFIFGDAAALFQNCHVIGRRGHTVTVSAQGRAMAEESTGFAFHNCTVEASPELAAEHRRRGFLGRPWRRFARTVYMQSYIGGFVDPAGWREWNGTAGLDTLYYGEFENYGPGANTSHRVRWPGYRRAMSVSEALAFTVHNFTDGGSWLPNTNIPFTAGLL